MADALPSRLGAINQGTDTNALFKMVFTGEVYTAFSERNVMMDKHLIMHIDSGKSASFPVTGSFTAEYHVAGAELKGAAMNHNHRIINVDDMLIAQTFVADIDNLKNHYTVRSIYAEKLGEALATTVDKHLLQVGIRASRAEATIKGGFGGSKLVDADFITDTESLVAGLFDAARTLDEKNVPPNDRYAFLRPKEYYQLVQHTKLLNKDWGGVGRFSEAELPRVAGLSIVSTIHVPNINIPKDSVEAGTDNRYAVDAMKTVGLVMHKEAIGTVKLMDLDVQYEYQLWRQGFMLVARCAMGHDILRPECAVELAYA